MLSTQASFRAAASLGLLTFVPGLHWMAVRAVHAGWITALGFWLLCSPLLPGFDEGTGRLVNSWWAVFWMLGIVALSGRAKGEKPE